MGRSRIPDAGRPTGAHNSVDDPAPSGRAWLGLVLIAHCRMLARQLVKGASLLVGASVGVPQLCECAANRGASRPRRPLHTRPMPCSRAAPLARHVRGGCGRRALGLAQGVSIAGGLAAQNGQALWQAAVCAHASMRAAAGAVESSGAFGWRAMHGRRRLWSSWREPGTGNDFATRPRPPRALLIASAVARRARGRAGRTGARGRSAAAARSRQPPLDVAAWAPAALPLRWYTRHRLRRRRAWRRRPPRAALAWTPAGWRGSAGAWRREMVDTRRLRCRWRPRRPWGIATAPSAVTSSGSSRLRLLAPSLRHGCWR